MQKIVVELEKLGQMPDESDDTVTSAQIDGYDKLLKAIEPPINYDEAEILVKLFPKTALYGVEWTLLHKFESVITQVNHKQYLQLVEACSSGEWKETLKSRFSN
jgi:hypothetical protein